MKRADRKFRRVLRALDAAVAKLSPERRELAAVQHAGCRETLRRAIDRAPVDVPPGVRPWVGSLVMPSGTVNPRWALRLASEVRVLLGAVRADRRFTPSYISSGAVRRTLRRLPARWRTWEAAMEIADAVEKTDEGTVALAIRDAATRGEFMLALWRITSPYIARHLGAQEAAKIDAADGARRAA